MNIELTDVWFLLIGVLFSGFFLLEGFDYGVGILLPFLGKDDKERRMIINTIGPFWDGNEVWVLTAGGAMFAAFPHWYATMFSGFYLALVLMLVALILRGIAFEFRSKDEHPEWRDFWDWAIFFGSFVPALLWGVAIANIVRGVPIGGDFNYEGNFFDLLNVYSIVGGLATLSMFTLHGAIFFGSFVPALLWGVAIANIVRGVPIGGDFNYEGNFFDLLNVYSIVGGLATLSMFTLHGAIFLSLKLGGEMEARVHKLAQQIWLPTVVAVVLFVVLSYIETDIFEQLGVNPGVTALGAAIALLSVRWFLKAKSNGWAFIMTGLTMILTVTTVFRGLYPRVMVSSLNEDWSLTITNASSSDYTLGVMTVIALTFVPIVLIYQGWTYWVFRKRITGETHLEY